MSRGDRCHIRIPSWFAPYVEDEIIKFFVEYPSLRRYWNPRTFSTLMAWREYRKGFSPSQVKYFRRMYGMQCAFCYRDPQTGNTVRCNFKGPGDLEVHHIVPSGWFSKAMPWIDVYKNYQSNGILLCTRHHWKVHPDIPAGFQARSMGDSYGFQRIFIRRVLFTMFGIAYWNTKWDSLFNSLNKRYSESFDKATGYSVIYPALESRATFPDFSDLEIELPKVSRLHVPKEVALV